MGSFIPKEKEMILIRIDEDETIDESMTVGELIDHLKNYKESEIIGAEWEGVHAAIKTENFERE